MTGKDSPFATTGRSRRGEPFVWLSAAGLVVGLAMVLGLLALVGWKGIASFWPSKIGVWEVREGGQTEQVFGYLVKETVNLAPGGRKQEQIQIFQGEGESIRQSFRYLDRQSVVATRQPEWMLYVERSDRGVSILEAVAVDGPGGRVEVFDGGFSRALGGLVRGGNRNAAKGESVEQGILIGRSADGELVECSTDSLVRVFAPNRASLFGRVRETVGRIGRFLSEEPRQANTAGGVWPAILGTVVMTILMSGFVTPFGVIAAIYLREYARQGVVVRLVRICVNNLAGVPSIVFGVFGLAFFVLFVGGTIDQVFYPESQPAPTFKTPGILWASLTLAVLTLPVVIVSTEEAFASVPVNVREAALACGASKWQMIQRVLLPASMPGILTGVILAMARGAGEVAPLMLVGVVKYAPSLPVDGIAPYFHPERKFMHLGFHIYDLGLQSPDSEAVQPMVYATALLLILVVICLNLFAILLRSRLRKRYVLERF